MNEFFVSLGMNVELNETIVNNICERLSEKYGGSFAVKYLGDRLDTDHAKVYAYPEDKPEELFCAYLYRETGILEDDFTLRNNLRKVSDAVEKAFENEGLKAAARVSTSFFDAFGIAYEEMSPKDLAEKYGQKDLFMYMAIKTESTSNGAVEKALRAARAEINTDLDVIGFCYADDNYDTAEKIIKEGLDSGSTPLEACKPTEMFRAGATENGCSFSIEKPAK